MLLAGLWLLQLYLTRDAVRGLAPPLATATVAGTPFDLEAFRGAPAVVYFWATWCPVCEAEQGTIEALAADHQVITVAMQSGGDARLRWFMAKEGLSFPVIADPDGFHAGRYGVTGVPIAFVLDPQGDVQFVTRGYTTGPGLRARLFFAGL